MASVSVFHTYAWTDERTNTRTQPGVIIDIYHRKQCNMEYIALSDPFIRLYTTCDMSGVMATVVPSLQRQHLLKTLAGL